MQDKKFWEVRVIKLSEKMVEDSGMKRLNILFNKIYVEKYLF